MYEYRSFYSINTTIKTSAEKKWSWLSWQLSIEKIKKLNMIIVYVFILLIVNWWFVVEIGFKFQDQNEELENIQVMMLELMDWRKKIMSRKLTNVRTAVILFCQRWGLFFRYYMTKRKGNTKTQKIILNVPLLLIVYFVSNWLCFLLQSHGKPLQGVRKCMRVK